MNTWCPHITKRFSKTRGKEQWFFKGSWTNWVEGIADEWNACPLCSAQKPRGPKELWEELKKPAYLVKDPEDYGNALLDEVTDNTAKRLANIAKSWFMDRMKEMDNFECYPFAFVPLDQIRKAIGYEDKANA